MTEPMPPAADEPRIGIPRQIRFKLTNLTHRAAHADSMAAAVTAVVAFEWLRDCTYPVDPPWVPDPAAVSALVDAGHTYADNSAYVYGDDAAARLVWLHDAGWELTRTEAPR